MKKAKSLLDIQTFLKLAFREIVIPNVDMNKIPNIKVIIAKEYHELLQKVWIDNFEI